MPKTDKLGSQFDPYNNVIFPGCSSTPPGQEMFAAYEKQILQEHRLHLEFPFDVIRKRTFLENDNSSEDDITENVFSCFHNEISNAKRPIKKKAKTMDSDERNMDSKYRSKKKSGTHLCGNKHLPVKKQNMYSKKKTYTEQIPVMIPNIQVSQISEIKPKVMYFRGNEYMSEKKENIWCLKSTILEVKKIPKKELTNGCVLDKSLDVEHLVEKAKMLCFHDKLPDKI